MREAAFILIMSGGVCLRQAAQAAEIVGSRSGTSIASMGIVDSHELTITLTRDTVRTFSGGYRELNLFRARLLMALEGEEIGIVSHLLSSGRVSVRADELLEVGPVRTV